MSLFMSLRAKRSNLSSLAHAIRRRLLRRAFALLAMTRHLRRERRPYLHLRRERAVHRALVGDLHEPLALRLVERALECDRPRNAVELALLGLAGGAIGGVDLLMRERDRHAPERQPLLVGI